MTINQKIKEFIDLIRSDSDYYEASLGYDLKSPKDILEIMEGIDGFSDIEVPKATLKEIKEFLNNENA